MSADEWKQLKKLRELKQSMCDARQGLKDTRGLNTRSPTLKPSQQHTETHTGTLESAALSSTPHGMRRDTDTACRQRC